MTDNTEETAPVATAAAVDMATDATSNVETQWPARYYASYDTSATGPTEVTGWYDVWGMSSTANVPAAAEMLALTAEQWAARLPYGQGVHEGTIVAYTPPSTVTLADQAATAYSAAVATVQSEYGVLNEPTPDDWVTYLKALKAIRDGVDTTSTALPAAPAA
ncbi:hypothetical protein [Frateuria aurantia]|uniref:Uncharacterized protein n=1 Tax=Frateuria aurantia (strain ATCC 33424 / DSM 6220 / KCTC 2777 / LMG 1558 / NBRC 3245 / NCIMB 13370) TaxID=767434 RepID=H8L694_FRAAD|nr:hypothetical protein [Frateuria aurantia]AFC85930.1 hypothetical protein Fraau_1510 [Frateuria aurantia DSM 6220]